MTKRLRYYGESYLFLLPSALLTIVLGIYPIAWAVRYMFFEYRGYGEARFTGLYNFRRLLADDIFWNSVWNTFVYAGGKLLLTIPLALLLAVILNEKFKGRHFFRTMIFMPTVVSAAVISVVFFIILNSYNGILNQYLLEFGIVERAVNWLGVDLAMLSVIVVASWGAIGSYMLLFIAGLQNIPRDVYESAELDGANGAQKFWYVTIPMLGPVLNMIVMLAITVALKGYESIMVLTEGGPVGKTEVMYLYVYRLLFPMSTTDSVVQQVGYGSAVAFTSALIVGALTGLYFLMARKLNKIY